jgi:hypothetical protein
MTTRVRVVAMSANSYSWVNVAVQLGLSNLPINVSASSIPSHSLEILEYAYHMRIAILPIDFLDNERISIYRSDKFTSAKSIDEVE